MEKYFNIRYEFDKLEVHRSIEKQLKKDVPGYICVADGNILTTMQRDPDYNKMVEESIFSICDSSWVPKTEHLINSNGVWLKQGSKEELEDVIGQYLIQIKREDNSIACKSMKDKLSYNNIAKTIINVANRE